MALTNYVKFVRGTTGAFQKRINAGTIDKDTLYFVYPDKDSLIGQLYLGTKLLSGSSEGDISTSSIGNLKDIVLTEVQDRQLLIYDSELEKWVNTSIDNAIGIMLGATKDIDGDKGLVPTPNAGDQNKVLKGNGSWENEFISELDDQSFQVTNGKLSLAEGKSLVNQEQVKKINDLVIDEDGKISLSAKISSANVEGLQELLDEKVSNSDFINLNTKVEDLDSILNDIKNEKNEIISIGLKTKVQNLEDVIYGYKNEETNEQVLGLQEQIQQVNILLNGNSESEDGTSVLGLNDKIENIITKVGNLDDLIDNRNSDDITKPITVVEAINNLSKLLVWDELDENNIYNNRQIVQVTNDKTMAEIIESLTQQQILVLNGDEIITDDLTIGSNIVIDANGAEFTGNIIMSKDAIVQNAKFTGNVTIQ